MSAEGLAPTTLLQVLDSRAKSRADRIAYTFLRDGEVENGSLTYRTLRERSLALAATLASRGGRGERAILAYPQGLEYIVALFGCFYAGVIAVPAILPNRKLGIEILRRVAADSSARWLLSAGAHIDPIRDDFANDATLAALQYIDTEADPPALAPEGWAPTPVGSGALALLQYTSGSTGSPRGVAITHANLVHNQRQIAHSCGDTENRIVSWLPMFHDMGLGVVLRAMWSGGSCVLMSPQAFLQGPRRWLSAISAYRATTSGAPDFAFDLCARRISRGATAGLDLSSWTVAFNGSEPVRAATIARFAKTFASCGFRREAFVPLYGLAEATVFVSGSDPGDPPQIASFSKKALEQRRVEAADAGPDRTLLVGCGHAWLGADITIVDPDTRVPCPPDRVGEIWIRGANVAAGYWGKETETETTFGATTADGSGPFLRTGDLGFCSAGHLFVTGRLKDLIIVRGRNLYPQDIEASVSTCHPALVHNGCAAFSIDAIDAERLVIVQEVAREALRTLDVADVVRAIRRAVSEGHAVHTHAIVLVKPTTLPRTSSGKIRHDACRRAFLAKTLFAVTSWTAPTAQEPNTDADPDSERRDATARADELIEWLRRHAADLIGSYSNDGRRTVPAPLLRDLARQGLLGMQVDPQYGGLGLGHADTARALEQLAAFDFALALFVGLSNYLGTAPVAKYGAAHVKAVLLPGLVHGEELAAFALEEPGGKGKRATELTTLAVPDGEEHWRLFGTKYLDGVTQGASVINVFVRHEEPPGMSAFIVSDGIKGLGQLRDKLSMGVLGFTRETIVLDGVRVGRDNLLGALGSGVEIAREALMHTRLAIGAACVGGMKRCLQLAGRDGPYFGTVVGKLTPNPLTLSRLGSVTARVAALECLVNRTARAIDAGHDVPAEAFSACRILGPELLLRTIDDLMQLGIIGGYAETNQILWIYRDTGLLRNLDGPPEAIAEVTGAAFMESDASLRLLVQDVLCAPELVRFIAPVVDAVRDRMTKLQGALARRAQRWGDTRAGELAVWLVLLAAVEGSRRAAPGTEVERAHAWAEAQFDQALKSVTFGTPSESATLDASDVAATFAPFTLSMSDVGSARKGPDGAAVQLADGAAASTRDGASSTERPRAAQSAKREFQSWIVSWLAHRLQIPVSQVEPARSFADHGLDSVASVELARALSDRIGRELDETLLWNFSTIAALVDYFTSGGKASDSPAKPPAGPSPKGEFQPPSSSLDLEIERLERELKSRP